MHSFSAEGIILKRKNFGEADKILTIFTKNKGKISALARGVRKVSSRRAPNLELLNQVKLSFSLTNGLPIVTEAETLNPFKNIKAILEKISLAYLVAEMVDQFLADEQQNYEIFNLLSQTLSLIDGSITTEKARIITQAFQVKLLSLVGYSPELYQCIRCQRNLGQEENFIAPSLGGVVDKDCSRKVILSQPISQTAFKALRFFKNESLLRIASLYVKKAEIEEIDLLLIFYVEYFLEKNLRSREFAEKLILLN